MQDFQLTQQQLSSLFHPNSIQNKQSYKKLQSWGPISSLQYLLYTNFEKGLNNDRSKHEKRMKLYGDNHINVIPQKSLTQIIKDRLDNKIMKILLTAAILSIVLKISANDIKGGLISGLQIFTALSIIIGVTSMNIYLSDRQFHKINNKSMTKTVKVYRSGTLFSILATQLLVGDIKYISAGDIISVDGILIQSNDIIVDQSSFTGNKSLKRKTVPKDLRINDDDYDPFIVSQTKIIQGSGKLLILAVGKNTYFGKLKLQPDQKISKTNLQNKLFLHEQNMNLFGLISAIIIFILLLFNTKTQQFFSYDTLTQIFDITLFSISIIVICVPQGIQLSISIANAYSIIKMKQGNNIVRFVQTCQIMGQVDNMCCDKTGTFTLNQMITKNIFIQGKNYQLSLKQTISQKNLKLFCLAVSNNTTANIVQNQGPINPQIKQQKVLKQSGESFFQLQGNKTQKALLQSIYELGYDYHHFRHPQKQVKRFSFDTNKKSMATIYKDDKQYQYAFVKGAPQFLMPYCTKYINQQGVIVNITTDFQDIIYDIVQDYGCQSLRTILIAYKQVLQIPQSWQEVRQDLILIAIVGITDKLRSQIQSAIQTCSKAQVNVRMITGDNKKTAIAIAKQSGLLNYQWYQKDNDCTVMQGRQFRQFIGGIINQGQQNQSIGDLQNFKRVRDQLKVLARCSPQDKYLMVLGLKNLGHVVSITGDGNNDAPALKKADIGFAIGSPSTQIAKQASHVILLDQNFNSIVNSIKWGRNVYDSIRKFLMFQLSVNIVVIGTLVIGILLYGSSIFTPLQILWINLIMDTLASIALATQSPTNQQIQTKPESSTQKLISQQMWIFIIFQGIIQLIIMIYLLIKLPEILNITNSMSTVNLWNDQTGKHRSMLFNIFIFMQIFNQLNARKIHLQEFNIFSNIFNNKILIVITLGTVFIQLFIMKSGSTSFQTVQLSFKQNIFCIVIGSIPLYSCLLMKIVIHYTKKCLNYFQKKKTL